MAKTKKTVLKHSTYEDHDMHFVFIDKELVFQGNTHDFTPYTHGPVVGGYNLEGKWDSGVESLCFTLKTLMEKEGKEVEQKTEKMTDRQYMKMGFSL